MGFQQLNYEVHANCIPWCLRCLWGVELTNRSSSSGCTDHRTWCRCQYNGTSGATSSCRIQALESWSGLHVWRCMYCGAAWRYDISVLCLWGHRSYHGTWVTHHSQTTLHSWPCLCSCPSESLAAFTTDSSCTLSLRLRWTSQRILHSSP
jgi:hypothetical protein